MSSRRRVHPLAEDGRAGRKRKRANRLSSAKNVTSAATRSLAFTDGNMKRVRLPAITKSHSLPESAALAFPQASGFVASKDEQENVDLRSESYPAAGKRNIAHVAVNGDVGVHRAVSSARKPTRRLQSTNSHLDIFCNERVGRKRVDVTSKRAIELQKKAETQRLRLCSVEPCTHRTANQFSSAAVSGSWNDTSPHSVVNVGKTSTEEMMIPQTVDQFSSHSRSMALQLLAAAENSEETETTNFIPLATLNVSTGPISVAATQFLLGDRSIINYLEKLSATEEDGVCVNFSHVDHLISRGAIVNAVDEFGQCALHVVAKDWGLDVLQYFLNKDAHLNIQDQFGRTALHVAASTNSAGVIRALLENGADHTLCTHEENQSPLHFAARSDAVDALTALLEVKADFERRDYKGRTPLQLAAELDRSESVRCLLDMKPTPANVGVSDYSGHMALTSMVATMPPVTKIALNQFHQISKVYRKQVFYLNMLEKPPLERTSSGYSKAVRSPLEMIVHYKHHDLITHPVIRRLIKVKWKQFGRLGAILQLLIFFIFLVALTAFAVGVDFEKKYDYEPLSGNLWRIIVLVISLLLYIYQVSEEITEVYRSNKQHKRWLVWRKSELERDLKFCHPGFPDEKEYLEGEVANLDDSSADYFLEPWNYIDWISYGLLLAAFVVHLVDVIDHTDTRARLHARLICCALIVAWFRVLKYVRAFSFMGPFVVMLQSMATDVCKFSFLYIIIYIPYAASFWIFFGDRGVSGFQSVAAGLFSLFRITLVDEYAYDEMHSQDSVMAYVLVGSFLALAAIVGLNLLIALMSDTFQRVYDNAKANAIMQQANTILNLEKKLTKSKLNETRREIYEKCGPLQDFYDDDENEAEDLKKMTFQIHDEVLELQNKIDNWHEGVTEQGDAQLSAITELQQKVNNLEKTIQRMSRVN